MLGKLLHLLIALVVFENLLAQNSVLLAPDFGDNGIVKFEQGFSSSLRSMCVLPNDEILIYAHWGFEDSVFQIRLNPDGSPNAAFAANGIKYDDIYPKMWLPLDLEVLPDNKYLALRPYEEGTFIPQSGFGITKHHLDGSLDTTFGVGGKTHIILGNTASPRRLEVQNDGKIVALGFRDGQVAVATRFYPNGAIDSTFDGNGVARVFFEFPTDMQVLPDNKTLYAGARGGGFPDLKLALTRLKADGSPDSTFATNGGVSNYFGNQNEMGGSLIVKPDGKLLLSASMGAISPQAGLVQFSSDGTIDQSFGTNGLSVTNFPYTVSVGAIHLRPDEKIIGFGSQYDVASAGPTAYYSSIARFKANGTLDTGFSPTGLAKFDVGVSSYITHVVPLQDGSFLLGGVYVTDLMSGPPHFYIAKTGVIDAISSTSQGVTADRFLIYPNPAFGHVNFLLPSNPVLDDLSLNIYDVNGRLVLSRSDLSSGDTFEWNTQNAGPGTYYCQFVWSGGLMTRKIVLCK